MQTKTTFMTNENAVITVVSNHVTTLKELENRHSARFDSY